MRIILLQVIHVVFIVIHIVISNISPKNFARAFGARMMQTFIYIFVRAIAAGILTK